MKQHDYAYISTESMSEQMDREYAEMEATDAEAKAEGTIIGRYLKEPAADSYAYYQVIAVDGKNNTLQLEHIAVYDAWSLPMYESMIDCFPIAYAMQQIEFRDKMDGFFAQQQKEKK